VTRFVLGQRRTPRSGPEGDSSEGEDALTRRGVRQNLGKQYLLLMAKMLLARKVGFSHDTFVAIAVGEQRLKLPDQSVDVERLD
jgi:hypothetical protein